MAGYDVSVSKELLPGLLSGQDGLAKLVEVVLNQILEAQVSESLGADRHERSEERQGYRNGYRPRTLFTRVGPVTRCKCRRHAMAVFRRTSSSATRGANRLLCWH